MVTLQGKRKSQVIIRQWEVFSGPHGRLCTVSWPSLAQFLSYFKVVETALLSVSCMCQNSCMIENLICMFCGNISIVGHFFRI